MLNEEVPSTLRDPVLRLTEYWFSARLMHCHVHSIRDDFPGLKFVPDNIMSDFNIYLKFWLSALYVVAEGYQELKLADPTLNRLVESHIASLRLFRNATFHFQEKPQKHSQFLDGTGNRLNWAEELHLAFETFFTKYLDDLGQRFG